MRSGDCTPLLCCVFQSVSRQQAESCAKEHALFKRNAIMELEAVEAEAAAAQAEVQRLSGVIKKREMEWAAERAQLHENAADEGRVIHPPSSYERMVVQKLEALQGELKEAKALAGAGISSWQQILLAVTVGIVGAWLSLSWLREFGSTAAATSGGDTIAAKDGGTTSPMKDLARIAAQMEELQDSAKRTNSLLQKEQSRKNKSSSRLGGSPSKGGILRGGITFDDSQNEVKSFGSAGKGARKKN